MFLKVVYSFFVGMLLVILIAMGVEAFYPRPPYPEMTYDERTKPLTNDVDQSTDEDELIKQKEYERSEKIHRAEMEVYSRNLFIVSLCFAILFMGIGIVFSEKINVIADGFLFGGIFTLIYGIGRASEMNDKLRFLAVLASLVIAITLGYLKFIKPIEQKRKS
jgi:hypothetical protein